MNGKSNPVKKKRKGVKTACPECGKEFTREYGDCRVTCPKCGQFFLDIDLG